MKAPYSLLNKLSFVLKPLYRFYSRKRREFNYKGLKISVFPGVFNPIFFYSTKDLIDFIDDLHNRGQNLLEMGCGSGMLSVYFRKKGCEVSAVDINQTALENTRLNAQQNNLRITVLKSDLFSELENMRFDVIAINPPYYKKTARSVEDSSWYAGPSFEYFQQLFSQIQQRIQKKEGIYMILSDQCDIKAINGIAQENNLNLLIKKEITHFFEKELIFQILPSS